jgi:hypothetical protein
MNIKDIIFDFLGVVCIFGTGYVILVLGHGVGF